MRIFILVLLIFSSVFQVFSQRRLKYDADSLSFVRENRQSLTYLIGNVIFKQETTTGYCDSAIYNRTENILDAFNNIRIIDDSTVITSQTLAYDGNNRKA